MCGVLGNHQIPKKMPAAGTETLPAAVLTGRTRSIDRGHGQDRDRYPGFAKRRKKDNPGWKRWRLQHPDQDKTKIGAYYRRNRDKLTPNSRIMYRMENEANAADLNEQEWV